MTTEPETSPRTNNMNVFFKKISPKATKPLRSTKGSAGFDLFSPSSRVIRPGRSVMIPLDIIMEIPPTHYGRIAPRSSLAYKHCIDVMAGVIDSDFRGNVGVILINHSKENDYIVEEGDKIAQIIFERIDIPKFIEKEELGETKRGEGGFGSTGK